MKRALPPLNWVRAFEAAGRHENFRLAADELGVSAGAISQKIKSLELRLGAQLFERHPKGVRLTVRGRTYKDALGPALDMIAAATKHTQRVEPDATLRITALPALAEKWLTPRLSQFQDTRPDVKIELSVAPEISALDRSDFDVALHYELEGRPELENIALFRDDMFPVCSPKLAKMSDLQSPRDLIGCRLLYDTQWANDWPLWFEAAGLPTETIIQESGFTLYSMAIEAAVAGQGVVIGHKALVTRDIQNDRLVAPFDLLVPAPHKYSVLIPDWSRQRPDVTGFVDWLRGEMTLAVATPSLSPD